MEFDWTKDEAYLHDLQLAGEYYRFLSRNNEFYEYTLSSVISSLVFHFFEVRGDNEKMYEFSGWVLDQFVGAPQLNI